MTATVSKQPLSTLLAKELSKVYWPRAGLVRFGKPNALIVEASGHILASLADQGVLLIGPLPPRTRLILASEGLLEQFGARTERGDRITAEWGEQKPEGWYEPLFTEHRDEGVLLITEDSLAAALQPFDVLTFRSDPHGETLVPEAAAKLIFASLQANAGSGR